MNNKLGRFFRTIGFVILIGLLIALGYTRSSRFQTSEALWGHMVSSDQIPRSACSDDVKSKISDLRERVLTVRNQVISTSEANAAAALAEEETRKQAEYARLGELAGYSSYMETSMGTMMFYAQADPRWGDYLWGGQDRLDTYGCGPVVLAMIANAFGNQGNVTPIDMAEWTDANGQRAPASGAYHSIVNAAMTAYGLNVESLNNRLTAEVLTEELRNGHILVALVKNGYFTKGNGHFIIIRGINEDGTVTVANPATMEHNSQSYAPDFVINELKTSATDAGSPLWSVSKIQ